MKNWTIGKRIIVGGSILLAFLVAVGVVASISLASIKRLAEDRLQSDALPGIICASDLGTITARVHIRALMARQASDEKEREAAIARSEENVAKATAALETYEKVVDAGAEREQFEALKAIRANYSSARHKYYDMLRSGAKAQEVDAYIGEKLEPAYIAYRDKVGEILKHNQDLIRSVSDDVVSTSSRATVTAETIVVAAVLLGVAIGWFIIRQINQALGNVSSTIQQGSEQVAAAAGQVSATSQALANGSSEQAASLEETSSSLEEMASMAKRNADNVQQAKELAGQTRQAADAGTVDMREMKQAMDAIKASSDEVAKIIKSIDEIAFQTNILALNAAVEAARAGEAGAGFAVVADEVRNLAQRSAQSAKETATKIEESIAKSEHGVRISEKVAASLDIIAEKTRKVDAIVAEITTATDEQRQGVDQVNVAVGQMDKVTQSNASSAEECASAAEELNAQSMTLNEAVRELTSLVGNTSSTKESLRGGRVRHPAEAKQPVRHAPVASATKSRTAARIADDSTLTFKDIES